MGAIVCGFVVSGLWCLRFVADGFKVWGFLVCVGWWFVDFGLRCCGICWFIIVCCSVLEFGLVSCVWF